MQAGRWLGVFFAVAVGAVLAAEIFLQVAARFAPDRSSAWRPGSTQRVLCVGDSHTWGAGVERSESYPAQLQLRLDESQPGVYSVMNLGLPGMNTAQVRSRVPDWLSRHDPDVLIVWVGVNNAWNSAEMSGQSSPLVEKIDRALLRSRVYRLARVRMHDRSLERYAVVNDGDLVWQPESMEEWQASAERERHTVRHDGVLEIIEHEREEQWDVSRIELGALADFRAIAATARSTGTRVIFAAYPLHVSGFAHANMAAWRTAEEFDVPLVRTWLTMRRLPPKDREWLWGMHPGPALYAAISEELAALVQDADSRAPTDMSVSEFRRVTNEQWDLTLRALRGLALAEPPMSDEEKAQLDNARRMLVASGYEASGDESAVQPDVFAAALEDQTQAADALVMLERFARSDGGVSPQEQRYLEAIAAALKEAGQPTH